MKATSILLTAAVAGLFSLNLPARTLFFAGDSTLDDHGRKVTSAPHRSWGTELEKSMKPGNRVDNRAASGRSTRTFVDEGRWDKLVKDVQPGDFVAIAFGHNDMKCDGKYRDRVYAAAKGAYSDYLRRFVKEVRAKGATPILMSPIRRGSFGKDGKLVEWKTSCGETLATYAEAARAVAKEQDVEFVDMHELTRQLLEKVGKAESDKFFVISTGWRRSQDGEPEKDVTHPVQAGAEAFSKLFLDDIRRRNLSVAQLF